MILLSCTRGEQMEECDDTACVYWGEQMEECDDTACVYWGEQMEECDDTACVYWGEQVEECDDTACCTGLNRWRNVLIMFQQMTKNHLKF